VKIDDFQKLTKLQWSRTEEDHRKMVTYLKAQGVDPGNFYQELEMSAPFVNTHRDVSYYNAPVNLHSHNYTEIIYCRSCADVEYLVAGHHGSKNSTSNDLLDVLAPEAALISVGSNSYGHPAEETLRRLAEQDCTVYRTDAHGDIRLSWNEGEQHGKEVE